MARKAKAAPAPEVETTEATATPAPEAEYLDAKFTPVPDAVLPKEIQGLSAEQEQELINNAPITEVAAYLGVDLDTAVQLRVDNAVIETYESLRNTQASMEVTARPITPIGNLVGFASVKFNNSFVVEDFKIVNGNKGLFVGMPSKPDKNSEGGYRDTAKPITATFRNELIGAVINAYHSAVKDLQERAAAIPPPESINKQLADGAQRAAQENAARPATAIAKPDPNAER